MQIGVFGLLKSTQSMHEASPIYDGFYLQASYSYHDLPNRYWRKYNYASNFVDLVRSKTPKVTLYTDQAKCILMENGPSPDFEACFYNGRSWEDVFVCVCACVCLHSEDESE